MGLLAYHRPVTSKTGLFATCEYAPGQIEVGHKPRPSHYSNTLPLSNAFAGVLKSSKRFVRRLGYRSNLALVVDWLG